MPADDPRGEWRSLRERDLRARAAARSPDGAAPLGGAGREKFGIYASLWCTRCHRILFQATGFTNEPPALPQPACKHCDA